MPLVRGRALRLGPDVNTDVIMPARFMNDWANLGKHVLKGESDELSAQAQASRFIVAGKNFGCGSSREQAVTGIKQAGIACVIAPTFARIFYRNAVNQALPVLEADVDVADGAELEVDVTTGDVSEPATGRSWKAKALPEEARRIVEDGGLIEHLKKKLGPKGP